MYMALVPSSGTTCEPRNLAMLPSSAAEKATVQHSRPRMEMAVTWGGACLLSVTMSDDELASLEAAGGTARAGG